MRFVDLDTFIKQRIRFKQHTRKKVITAADAVWQTLDEDTHIGGYDYARGSRFKVFETKNFGWVWFDHDTKTPNGWTPGKRVLKW